MTFQTALLLALLATGCAAKTAYKQGERLAEQGRWDQALTHYERALDRRPSLPGLTEAADRARGQVVAAHLQNARTAQASADWRACFAALKRADAVQPNLDETRAIRADCAGDLLDEAAETSHDEDLYQLAAALAAHAPEHPELPALYGRARGLAEARADRLAALQAWPEALAAIDLIATYEPGWADTVQVMRQRLQQRWAAALRDQADDDAERGHRASALVRIAQAAELSGLSTDQTRRDAERRALTDRYGLSASVVVRTPRGRPIPTWVLPTAREGFGEGVPVAPDLEGAAVRWTLDLEPVDCAQQSRTRVGEVQVERGREPYDNPAWTAQHQQLAALQDGLAADQAALGERYASIRALRRGLDTQADLVRTTQAAVDGARQARDRQHDLLQAAAEAWSSAAQAFDPSDPGTTAALEPARRAWVDADAALRKAEAGLSTTLKKHRSAVERFRQGMAELDDALDAAERAIDDLSARRSQLAEQSAALSQIPVVLYRPRIEVVRYPIHRVTTRCQARIEIHEPGAHPVPIRGVAESETDTHDAVVEAGIEERPPPPREATRALRDRARDALAAALRDHAGARVEAWRQSQLQLAAQHRQSRPDEALARQIAVYLHEPSQPPPDLARTLLEVFSVDDPTILLPR